MEVAEKDEKEKNKKTFEKAEEKKEKDEWRTRVWVGGRVGVVRERKREKKRAGSLIAGQNTL
jgi:hypothetical protein